MWQFGIVGYLGISQVNVPPLFYFLGVDVATSQCNCGSYIRCFLVGASIVLQVLSLF